MQFDHNQLSLYVKTRQTTSHMQKKHWRRNEVSQKDRTLNELTHWGPFWLGQVIWHLIYQS